MPAWISTLFKILWVLVKLYFLFLVFCLIGLAFIFVTAIGDHMLVNETVHLAPGEAKSYYLPPGMVYVNINSDVPIDERADSPTSRSSSYGTTWSSNGHGTPFGVNDTLTNPGDKEATVNVRISTGVLNPFGYALYGI